MLKEEEKESWTGVPRKRAVNPPAIQSGGVWVGGVVCGNKMSTEDKSMHG